MLNFFKRRREQRERAAQLQELGRTLGESLNAEVELFIQMNITPRREGFTEVLKGQLARLTSDLPSCARKAS